ncbi:MAG: hypothetical protein EOO20_17660 [Chryseobacterium sp.]|nr:MAG: hypothetical protein EOO20_17660 [Chryseobacterium sp.]
MITKNPSKLQDLNTMIKQRDFFKGILIAAGILWPCIIAAAIYFYFKKNSIALFIPAFTIFLSFLPIYLRLKSLNAEIKSKQLS